MNWEKWFKDLGDEVAGLAVEEAKDLINAAKEDSVEFTKRQGLKVERYLEQVAAGLITKEEVEGYLLDIKDLTEMKALEMEVEAKARAQRLANGIKSIVVDKLVSLIPSKEA